MAKPDDPGSASEGKGQDKTFWVIHPTEQPSPKQVTQEEWAHDQMASKGWKKAEGDEIPHVEHHE